MANLDQISPDIIQKIAAIIGQKLQNLGEFSRESYGGVRAVADMFNRLDSSTSKDILGNVEQQDPSLFETIRKLMFVFEDLLLIDQNGIKEVLARADRKLLTVALKGTSEQLQNHICSSMSQRGAEMLKEDLDALGPVKIREVETAQQQIITRCPPARRRRSRQLEGSGGGTVCCVKSRMNRIPVKPIAWRTLALPGPAASPSAPAHAGAAPSGNKGSARSGSAHRCKRAEASVSRNSNVCASPTPPPHAKPVSTKAFKKPVKKAASRSKPLSSALAEKLKEVAGLRQKVRNRAEMDVLQLALAVARRILRRELVTDPEALHGVVHAALQKIQNRDILRVRIYPAAADALRTGLERAGAAPAIQIVPDPTLKVGDLLFETAFGELDASVETQMQEIERGLTDRISAR